MGEIKSFGKLDTRDCCGLEKLPESVLNLNQLEKVICDDIAQHLREPFLPTLKNTPCYTWRRPDDEATSVNLYGICIALSFCNFLLFFVLFCHRLKEENQFLTFKINYDLWIKSIRA